MLSRQCKFIRQKLKLEYITFASDKSPLSWVNSTKYTLFRIWFVVVSFRSYRFVPNLWDLSYACKPLELCVKLIHRNDKLRDYEVGTVIPFR